MFDWQTDEDAEAVWEEESLTNRRPHLSRKWLGLIGLFIVLVGAGWWGVRYVIEQQANEVTIRIEQDILASHTLLQELLGSNDRELILTFLSGRDVAWTRKQADLFMQNLALQNAPQVLGLQPNERPPLVMSLTFSEGLREAVMLTQHTYTDSRSNLTFNLQRQLIYRRGVEHWLLSPPDESLWGETMAYQEPLLTLHATEYDSAIAQKLAVDLSSAIEDACGVMPDLPCDRTLTVHLSVDPAGLTQLNAPNHLILLEDGLSLPAPALIGTPLDGAGYQALLHAYQPYILAAYLNEAVGWECCQNAGGYEALLSYQLSQLGVLDWPLPAETYLEFAFVEFDTASWQNLGEPVTLLPLQAIVQYSVESRFSTAPTFLEMAHTLTDTFGYWSWVAQLGAPVSSEDELIDDIQAFILSEMRLADQVPLADNARPGQDLALLCRQPTRTMYRYSFGTSEWQEERNFVDTELVLVGALPDDSGYFINFGDFASTPVRSMIVREGHERIIADDNESQYGFFPISPQPIPVTGHHMLLGYREQVEFEGFAILDYAACDLDLCSWQSLVNWPTWSPTGEYYIAFLKNGNLPLGLVSTDSGEVTELGQGHSPFWLDDQTYGHFGGTEGSSKTTRIATLDNPIWAAFLHVADVARALPAGETSSTFTFLDMYQIPNHEGALLFAYDEEGTYLFLVEREDIARSWRLNAAYSGINVTLVTTLPGKIPSRYTAAEFVFDGRVARHFQTIGDERIQHYLVIDWQTGTAKSLPSVWDGFGYAPPVDWSADGKWVARPGTGYIHILSPNTPYQQHLFPPGEDCTTPFWLNR